MENISPVIVILKNGDQIVCTLKEVFDGDEQNKRGICLLMMHPYILSLMSVNNKEDLQVKFTKWCPYSPDIQFKIPYDAIVAIGSCDSRLLDAYIQRVQTLEESQEEHKHKIVNKKDE